MIAKIKTTLLIAAVVSVCIITASCASDKAPEDSTAAAETTLGAAAIASGYDTPPAWAAAFSQSKTTENNSGTDDNSSGSDFSTAVSTNNDLAAACSEYGSVNKLTVTAADNSGVAYNIFSYKASSEKTLYLFLPCTADIKNVTFFATHKNGTKTGPYTKDFSAENVSAEVSDKQFTVTAMQSNIPTLYIQVDESEGKVKSMNSSSDHSEFCYGDVLLAVTDELASQKGWQTTYISEENDSLSPCTMKIRGRGNWTWNQDKKPYQFKTENKLDLLGMGKAKNWILLANVMDASLLRDQLFFDLSSDMGLHGSPDIEPVDVFMNGEYLGSYSLCEKVEVGQTRVNIDENKDFLLEIDHYFYNETYTVETEYGTHLTLHNREDYESMDYIENIISSIESEIHDKSTDYYQRLLDMDSWVKYFWVQELSRNNDTMIGSCYMYYVVDEDKLYAGPIWDMDNTLGIWGSGINLKTDGDHCRLFNWFGTLLKHPNFEDAVYDYYNNKGIRELFAALPSKIDAYADYIHKSAEMNYVVNDKNHYVHLDTVTYDDEVDYLKSFLSDRLDWLDNKYHN